MLDCTHSIHSHGFVVGPMRRYFGLDSAVIARFSKYDDESRDCYEKNKKNHQWPNFPKRDNRRAGFHSFILKNTFTFRTFVMAFNIGNLNVGFAEWALDLNHMNFTLRTDKKIIPS